MWQKILEATNEYFHAGLDGFLITSLVIVVAVFLLRKIIRRFISQLILKNRVDETGARFAGRIVFAALYTFALFAIILQIVPLRNVSVSLLAGSGVAVLVIGFAAQEAFSNIIAGFFISFFRPFSVGELINLPSLDVAGYVEDINLRHTVIRTFTNQRIIVPNSTMNSVPIENRDIYDSRTSNYFVTSISYSSNVDLARSIMIEEASNHPNLIDIRTPLQIEQGVPLINVSMVALNESSVTLRCSLWSENYNSGYSMINDLRESTKKRFDQAGIEVPFPTRTIHMK